MIKPKAKYRYNWKKAEWEQVFTFASSLTSANRRYQDARRILREQIRYELSLNNERLEAKAKGWPTN